MSETIAETSATLSDPGAVLLNLIVALLAPMFLGVTGGNVDLAHAAARDTINDYRARSGVDLICIGQIIAFGLASIGTITQSMDEDVPLETALRLNASADRLSRSAERSRRALDRVRREIPVHPSSLPPDGLPDHLSEAKALGQLDPPRTPITPPTPQPQSRAAAMPQMTGAWQARAGWAAAFADVAQEIAASLPCLPPAEHRDAKIRAAALSSAATTLLGATQPPRPNG